VTPDLSIVIPAYNEAERIPSTLHELFKFFSTRDDLKEVIVVDDGSGDNTAQVVQELGKVYNQLRLTSLSQNSGKGAAVKRGMFEASAAFVLFCDADGSTPFSETDKLKNVLLGGDYGVAIGSRAMKSSDTKIEARLDRLGVGRVFNVIMNLLLVPGIKDTQCGFKMFTQEVSQKVFSKQKIMGFSFDVEILFLARKCGFRISEVPINWHHVPGSKINVVKDGLKMLLSALTIRFIHSTDEDLK
jgi:dolichyl-phosphate beta-glucosyltransferase